MFSQYWSALRFFLLAWLLVCLLGFAVTGFNLVGQVNTSNQLAQLEQQLHATRQQVMQHARYQAYVTFYLAHRTRWKQQKMNQPADRQQWVATWLALQQRWHLPHMQYDIQPAITCEGAACDPYWPGKSMAGLAMTVTPVRMRWSVHHEAEVLEWLQRLQHVYTGMFVLRGCSWTLEESTDLIAAQCELQLFNFPQMWPVSSDAICCD
ncbi:MAG: hypothetical protein ACT6RZ_09105 [Methylophilus sp.]|uniref:hypothetical protein n=2 Tax=Methylophilus sp. TaxID=29541 RepID=UPI00403566E6